MYRLITASYVLALGLSLPILAADEKSDKDIASVFREVSRKEALARYHSLT